MKAEEPGPGACPRDLSVPYFQVGGGPTELELLSRGVYSAEDPSRTQGSGPFHQGSGREVGCGVAYLDGEDWETAGRRGLGGPRMESLGVHPERGG